MGTLGRPEVGHLTFDAYPDVRDYSVEDLKETYFAELGNGEKSKLIFFVSRRCYR